VRTPCEAPHPQRNKPATLNGWPASYIIDLINNDQAHHQPVGTLQLLFDRVNGFT
jgi:hypothetical protein